MPAVRNQLKGCRVLVVEDEYFIASDLENAFREHGAAVIGPIAELSEAMKLVDDGAFCRDRHQPA